MVSLRPLAASLMFLAPSVVAARAEAPPAAPKSSPARPASPSFDQLAVRAAQARDAGHSEDAIRYFRQALALRPAWTEGSWSLGTVLYDLGRYEEARDCFRRVVATQPANGLVLALQGLCEF
ncbi:MAG: hypothetical protein DMF77_17345, partial [Acidobacteria bacterium]